MAEIQTCIIGAGVIGLALAAELAKNKHEVVILEQALTIGSETSSRNSEVIHAGSYYPKNSLKAKLCVAGKKLLYDYCRDFHIPHSRIGKWIIATNETQLEILSAIRSNAEANDVHDLEFLDASTRQRLEPELSCVGALHSPSTGIIDSHSFMLSLQGEFEAEGGQIAFGTKVENVVRLLNGTFSIETNDGDNAFSLTTKNLVLCGGLNSATLLSYLNLQDDFGARQTRFAKGNYFKLNRNAPFSRLLYPVPEPGGLGVHLTLDLEKQAKFGPDVEWVESLNYEVDPTRVDNFYSAIRTYWPDLPDQSLVPDYSGIRPKLVGPGEPDADFLILDQTMSGVKGLTALLGIESPGLTASLALANLTAEII